MTLLVVRTRQIFNTGNNKISLNIFHHMLFIFDVVDMCNLGEIMASDTSNNTL